MLETEKMDTNYAYGDNKTSDSANFGIFKQNWGMMRNVCSQFKGQTAAQWNNGAALNSNLSQDVSCLNQSQSYYGMDLWFASHRNGSSGLANPYTQDITNYKNGIKWIQSQIDGTSGGKTNDTRWWANIVAI
jgi:hypothetical protein